MKQILVIVLAALISGCIQPPTDMGIDASTPIGPQADFIHSEAYDEVLKSIPDPLNQTLESCNGEQFQPALSPLIENFAVLRAVTAITYFCSGTQPVGPFEINLESTLQHIQPGTIAEYELLGHIWWLALMLHENPEGIYQGDTTTIKHYLALFASTYPWTEGKCSISTQSTNLREFAAAYQAQASNFGFHMNQESIGQLEGTIQQIVIPGIEYAEQYNATTLTLVLQDYLHWGQTFYDYVEEGKEPNKKEAQYLLNKYRSTYRSLWTDFQLEGLHSNFADDNQWPSNPAKPFIALTLSSLESTIANSSC